MSRVPSIDEMWDSAPRAVDRRRCLDELPQPAQRYLSRALPSDGPLAAVVRLRMSGEIRLGRWLPFRAEQVIRRDRQMRWDATARMYGLPIRGFDALADGCGEMRWKLLGLLPLLTDSGNDVTRSSAGRFAAETTWLPPVLCGDDVEWRSDGRSADPDRPGAAGPPCVERAKRAGVEGADDGDDSDVTQVHAVLTVAGEEVDVELTVSPSGRLGSVRLRRWGDPDGKGDRYVAFGGRVEREGTYDGYTIPTRLRVGWFFGEERFETEGEFFRVTVESAEFR